MNLVSTTQVLRIVLAEAMTTSNCDITSSYGDFNGNNFVLGLNQTHSNGTTPVTAVPAPAIDTQRQVKEIRLFNNDTVPHNVTLELFDGSTTWIVGTTATSDPVPVGGSFVYTPESGVCCTSGAGSVTSVVAQGGPFLAAGTITSSGTINNSSASLTAHGILIGEGASAVVATAAMTNGQLLVGTTGADPAPRTISGDATINSAGTLALATTGVTAASYGDATHYPTFTVDAKGRLTAAGTVTVGAGSVTSIVAGAGLAGGTITTSGTISLGTIAATQLLGNAGTVAGVPTGIAINSSLSLTTAGTLEIAPMSTGLLLGNGSGFTAIPHAISVGIGLGLFGDDLHTTFTIAAQGGPFLASGAIDGTGGTIANSTASLTPHGVLLGEGTSAAVATAAGTDGQLLIATTSADPAFTSMSGDATITKAGAITVTKSGGVAFGSAAFINTGTVGGTLGLLNTANSWSAAQRGVPATLTSGATVTPDFSLGNNFQMTMTVSGTLANPTNVVAGQAGQIAITQDGTGGRTLALGSVFKTSAGAGITLTTTAAAVDILSYYVADATHIDVSPGLNFK